MAATPDEPRPHSPAPTDADERLSRRALGLQASASVGGGLLMTVLSPRLGRELARRTASVAAAGVVLTLCGGAVAVQSLAEDWHQPARRAAVADAAGGVVLLSLAAADRGSLAGRSLLGAAGVSLLAGAAAHARALVRDADGIARL